VKGFLPQRALIDAYGAGGFRFAGMSHRGSLLALPSGMHAWKVEEPGDLTVQAFEPVFAEAGGIELLLVGTGRDLVPLSEALGWRIRELGMRAETMATGAAIRTWNVLIAEDRRVAAAFLAVE
jgi:uncharacterized protein